jgi:hypothetical protein
LLLYALCALYASLEGRGWKTSLLWLSDALVCNWHGVGCDEGGTVTSLLLLDNNLRGTLGSSIGPLCDLQTSDLAGNAIGGSIPLSLWKLQHISKSFFSPFSCQET